MSMAASVMQRGDFGAAAGQSPSPRTGQHARIFAHTVFISTLLLQRFGLPVGASAIFLSFPIFILLVGWLLISRRARFPAGSAIIFMLFLLSGTISTLVAVNVFDTRVGLSILSISEILILYAVLGIIPAGDFDTSVVPRIFLFYARLCAVCGIAQFALQFAHVRMFSFTALAPQLKPILVERFFQSNPLLKYGSTTLRSNGFFLLEPSTFSQILVMAIYVDYFLLNRKSYLLLYVVGYICSYSGTGLISLLVALAIVAPFSPKILSKVALIGLAAVVVGAISFVLLPDQLMTFVNRAGEINHAGTSGNARYVQAFQGAAVFAKETRSLIGYGPGSTERSIYWIPGTGNSLQQLFIDYGYLGIACFFAYFVKILFRPDQIGLTVLCLSLFVFGGDFLVFPPMLILFISLTAWSKPVTQARYDWAVIGQRARFARPSLDVTTPR